MNTDPRLADAHAHPSITVESRGRTSTSPCLLGGCVHDVEEGRVLRTDRKLPDRTTALRKKRVDPPATFYETTHVPILWLY